MPLSKLRKEPVCECISSTEWKSYSKESEFFSAITIQASIVSYMLTKSKVNNYFGVQLSSKRYTEKNSKLDNNVVSK